MMLKGILSGVLIILTSHSFCQLKFNTLKKSKNISELTFLLKNTKSKRKKQEIEHRIYNAKRDEMFVLAKNSKDTLVIRSYITTYEIPDYPSELKGCNYSYLSIENDISYFKSLKSCISNWKKVLKNDLTDTLELEIFILNNSTCELSSEAKDSLYQRKSRIHFIDIINSEENMLPIDQVRAKISYYRSNFNNDLHLKKLKEIEQYNSKLEQLINGEKTTKSVAEFISEDPYNPRVNNLNSALRISCVNLDKSLLQMIKNFSVEQLLAYSDSIFSEEGKREYLNVIKSKGIKNTIIHGLAKENTNKQLLNPTDLYSTLWFCNYSNEPMIVHLAGTIQLEIMVEPNSRKIKTFKNGVYYIRLNAPIYGKNSNIVEEIIYRDGAIVKGVIKNKKVISNQYEPVSNK